MPPERRRGDQPATTELIEEASIEDVPVGRRIAGRVQLGHQDAPRNEAGRERRDPLGATQEEPRGDHQDAGHRDLRRHEPALAPAATRHPRF